MFIILKNGGLHHLGYDLYDLLGSLCNIFKSFDFQA